MCQYQLARVGLEPMHCLIPHTLLGCPPLSKAGRLVGPRILFLGIPESCPRSTHSLSDPRIRESFYHPPITSGVVQRKICDQLESVIETCCGGGLIMLIPPRYKVQPPQNFCTINSDPRRQAPVMGGSGSDRVSEISCMPYLSQAREKSRADIPNPELDKS